MTSNRTPVSPSGRAYPTFPTSAQSAGAVGRAQGAQDPATSSAVAGGRTLSNIGYLTLALPMGIVYFTVLVTGLSLGFGLLITVLGIPILIAVLSAADRVGEFERKLTNRLLRLDTPPSPEVRAPAGVWAKAKTLMSSSQIWKRVGYLVAVLPFGVVGFSLVAGAVAAFGGGVVTPFFYEKSWWFTTEQWLTDRWVIDTVWEGLAVAGIGIVLAIVLIGVINKVAGVWGAFATRALGPSTVR